MKPALPALTGEFRDGWRILLGAALAAGTGVGMVFLNFSMFILPLSQELGVSRGDLGSVQALIVTAALGAPVMGRAADLFGVRRVFVFCTLVVACVHLLAATYASSLLHMAMSIAATGFFGIGSTAVVLTRPINAHFREHRGKALGLMAVGIALVSMTSPPLIQWLIDNHGWRAGFVGFAAASVGVGIPAVLLLIPRGGRAGSGIGAAPSGEDGGRDSSFLKERDFWLLTMSTITMSLATAGTVSQLAPMVIDEGIDAKTAALALSFFAGGQFAGRLVGGWLLDLFEPRRVAFFLTLMPAIGFVILLSTHGVVAAALLAAAIIGLQQGAELDIFAYFVGRRFDAARYGTIYGALAGLGWIGNVGGMLGMGRIYDAFGSYAPAQVMGIVALVVAAVLVLLVRLPDLPQARPA
ncbi:MAG: MFS transporter [Sphingomonadales bacterium]|nr:MFS transporter [Sphingomonadales bacterium]